MAVGVVHDLPVGVRPGGADTWAQGSVFAVPRHGRRAAGRVQPAGPGLEPAAVAAGPAGRTRVRAVPGHAARHPAARRRHPRRPRRRAVATVVDPTGRATRPGHLRALRPRGDARHPGAGGAPGRRGRDRRGPGHRAAHGDRDAAPARRAQLGRAVVPARLGRRGSAVHAAADWERDAMASITTHDLPTVVGLAARRHTSASVPNWACWTDRPNATTRRPTPTGRRWWNCWRATTCRPTIRSRRCTPCWPPPRRDCCSPHPPTRSACGGSPNLPGTVDEYPNWRIPLPVTLGGVLRRRARQGRGGAAAGGPATARRDPPHGAPGDRPAASLDISTSPAATSGRGALLRRTCVVALAWNPVPARCDLRRSRHQFRPVLRDGRSSSNCACSTTSGKETTAPPARGRRFRAPRLPARHRSRPALRVPRARPVRARSAACAATRTSCSSTRTPRRSRAAWTGTRRCSRTRSASPDGRNDDDSAGHMPLLDGGQPVLRLGQRPAAEDPVQRVGDLRGARQGPDDAPPRRARRNCAAPTPAWRTPRSSST